LPLLAAVSALYLYHRLYLAIITREITAKYQLIRVQEEHNHINLRTIVALFFLILFIPSVLYIDYKDKFAAKIPAPVHYLDIHRLLNLNLRERAFVVARKLDALESQYAAKRNILQKQFDRDKADFDRANTAFNDEKAKYEEAVRTCSSQVWHPIITLPLDSNQPLSATNPLGVTTAEPCQIPTLPNPPPEPKFPMVVVDSQWKMDADETQEEAAAIWEEMHHRAGGYTRFFYIPPDYNKESAGISEIAGSLENEANKLH